MARCEGQLHKNISNDDNTTTDRLLLMVDNVEEKAPLLSLMDNDRATNLAMTRDSIPLESRQTLSHCHVPEEEFNYQARNRLIIVLILCLIFMVIEILGGILSNSTAVITDAAHMCTDATGFLISLIAMFLATKRPTSRFSFGFVRAEVLGALTSVLTIWIATGILVYMAVGRCIDQTFEVRPVEMIAVASCGVVFNIIMFFVLHGNACGDLIPHHGHSHSSSHMHLHEPSHGHSHDEDSFYVDIHSTDAHQRSKLSENINVRAAVIHVIGDFCQSVGVLFASILIKFKPEYKLADPICTFLFSVFVILTTTTIMRDIVSILMEGVPANINYKMILDDLRRLPSVRNAHSLHIWSLSMQKIALSVHIAIGLFIYNPPQDQYMVLNQAQELLRHHYQITRSTIQIEIFDEISMNSCRQCSDPMNY